PGDPSRRVHDRHNFPEVVVSGPSGGHNFREVVTIMGYLFSVVGRSEIAFRKMSLIFDGSGATKVPPPVVLVIRCNSDSLTPLPRPIAMTTTGRLGSIAFFSSSMSWSRVSPCWSSFLPSVIRMTELTRLGSQPCWTVLYAASIVSYSPVFPSFFGWMPA